MLRHELARSQLLSESQLFIDSAIAPIYVAPLKVLSTIHNATLKEATYTLHVRDWAIDLNVTDDSLRCDTLHNQLSRPGDGTPPATHALLTPDTEERYFRIAYLHSDSRLRWVRFTFGVHSESGEFGGYFQRALERLAQHKLNGFGARNIVVSKLTKSPGGAPREEAEFQFLVDASRADLPRDDDAARKLLQEEMTSALEAHAQELGGSVSFDDDSFEFRQHDVTWPLCFLATNIKDTQRHRAWAGMVYRELLSLGLWPVNVDITMERIVRDDVESLLRASGVLVSIHVCEPKNILAQRDVAVPSDWVIFEEAYMEGLGRSVYRLREEKVRQPFYVPGNREFIFNDVSFDQQLRDLSKAIRRHLTTASWGRALESAGKYARGLDPSKLRRDLRAEYLVEPDRSHEAKLKTKRTQARA